MRAISLKSNCFTELNTTHFNVYKEWPVKLLRTTNVGRASPCLKASGSVNNKSEKQQRMKHPSAHAKPRPCLVPASNLSAS